MNLNSHCHTCLVLSLKDIWEAQLDMRTTAEVRNEAFRIIFDPKMFEQRREVMRLTVVGYE